MLFRSDVPESVVDMYLDARVKEFKDQAGDRLPENFDEDAFREAGREDSERQARWMFIRDRVIDQESFEISDDDRTAYFEETGKKDGLAPELLMNYYRSMPRLMSQLDDRLLSQRVVDWFAEQATVTEKDRDAFRAEAEAKQAAEEA